jgi:signal transduction histidine kinase
MLNVFNAWFSSEYSIAPWQKFLLAPDLIWFPSLVNFLAALADFSVPLTLAHLVRKRSAVPFHWPVILLGAFFVSCGTLHLLGMWTTLRPAFALPASVTAGLAASALLTSVILWRTRRGTGARDITETKGERTLQEKLEAAENANRAKDRFLATISHELRTPLNAILGYTGTLLMKLPGPLTAEQEHQLRIMQSSSRHLVSLLNELLDLARIESGKMEIHSERVACHWVLEEVAATLRPLAEGKGLPFYVTPPAQEMVLVTDRRALHQILLNLCHNAIKFTDHGAVRLRLEARGAPEDAVAEFSVTDTGIGIRDEDQDRLFQAFAQMPVAQNERQVGSGLGLHLSQKLAQMLGGKISFQSQAGQGSEFKLFLPLSPEVRSTSNVNLCRLASLSSKTTQLTPS